MNPVSKTDARIEHNSYAALLQDRYDARYLRQEVARLRALLEKHGIDHAYQITTEMAKPSP